MPNKTTFLFILWALPLIAHAEVLDKLPQIHDMWMHNLLGVLIAYLGLRLHWTVFLLAVSYQSLWFANLLMDLHSFDLGPAIIAEAGNQYAVNAHAAVGVWVVAVVGLCFWSANRKAAKK
ncbi:MAG TPA: hypothetical protein VFV43_00995 [Limnobacter sp.]|nr:hypothetical protein [Limnobacter sp.]